MRGAFMFWKNFLYLCSSIKRSPNSVAAELGISSGSVTAWKNGRIPNWNTLNRIALFFNVSDMDLLNDSIEKTVNFSIDGEKEILWNKYCMLDYEDRAIVNDLLNSLSQKSKYAKKDISAG